MISKLLFYLSSLSASAIMALTTGCASGGFKLTRQYAGFVNRQPTILRIIIYLLTGIVFAVTMLIDMVIFNTIDFWEGRVSAGSYEFKKGDKTFHVRHEFMPGTILKRSTIRVIPVSCLRPCTLFAARKGQERTCRYRSPRRAPSCRGLRAPRET